MAYNLGHTERLGNSVIKKRSDYGYKYEVWTHGIKRSFATIQRARAFALAEWQGKSLLGV